MLLVASGRIIINIVGTVCSGTNEDKRFDTIYFCPSTSSRRSTRWSFLSTEINVFKFSPKLFFYFWYLAKFIIIVLI